MQELSIVDAYQPIEDKPLGPREERRARLEHEVRVCLERGDQAGAAERIIAGYGPELLGYLVTTTRDVDAAQEVFSDVCLHLWSGLGKFRGEASVRTWLYVITHHAALRHARRERRKRNETPDSSTLEKLVAEVRSATLSHLKTERRDELARLRDALAPEDQALLVLRVDKQMAWDDIVRILDERALSGVEQKRAAARLRKRFERIKLELHARFAEAGLVKRS